MLKCPLQLYLELSMCIGNIGDGVFNNIGDVILVLSLGNAAIGLSYSGFLYYI